jgi:hypothetical protein
MRESFDHPFLVSAGHQCRRVAALLIARIWPGRSFPAVLDGLSGLPVRSQAWLVAAVLGLLFAIAIVAAQFGPAGLAVYFAAVILLAR